MGKQSVTTISYFSDVLCVWAYAAQIKLEELQRQFGDQVRVEYYFIRLFGDVSARIEADWEDKGRDGGLWGACETGGGALRSSRHSS